MQSDEKLRRNPSVEPYYLPMDCPVCGRRRMQWDGKVLSCEKCTASSEWDAFESEHYSRRLRDAAQALVDHLDEKHHVDGQRESGCIVYDHFDTLRTALKEGES